MEYIVTLIETTVHTVLVESDEVGIKLDDDARRQWINGEVVDDNARLLSLEVTEVTAIPMEDVA
jgi:hypothetical protein